MKNVLITGVAGGMGHAAALKFIQDGWRVFGLDIKEPEPAPGLVFIKTDLTSEESVSSTFSEIEKICPELDCIASMAGIYDMNSLVEIDEEHFKRIFDVNLFSVYRVNRVFLPLLKKGGRIIIVSSELAPLDPLPFTGLYGITKSALEKYACSLRMELQLIDRKVTVIRPGAVDTGLLDVSKERLKKFTENTDLYSYNAKRFEDIVNTVEAKKIPPEKVAKKALRAANERCARTLIKINRNPLLLLLNSLPNRFQLLIIKRILSKK